MSCPSCGHENRETAKFCGKCAVLLSGEVACPECGSLNPPGQQFCDSCAYPLAARAVPEVPREPRAYTPKHLAEKILTSRSALEGERKQVTVLFADVQGSVALSESVDPETLHKIMDRFFVILADGVHRFEGTVNQYTGDGIMALFGAPIAHEDHAQRACYAALHLTDELRRYADELRVNQGLSFAVRMGLNSGEVVVGKIGDDLRMDYTAQGHTVGLAARMEQITAPDRVNLTQHTASLVKGFFQLRDLGPLAVKGVRDPLCVYELQGVGPLRTRLEVSQARGFSRFVGRSHETQALETALAQALEGHGQVVGVVGEAGVGKSRLCLEFVDHCRTRGTPVYEAHCPAHGKTLPFVAVLELFRAYFGIAEQDSDIDARKKIAGMLLLLGDEFRDVLPLVFDFLGVPDPERPAPRIDPEARQRQLFAFLHRLVERQSAHEPGVLLLDDVHWIDAGSDTFLAQLVEAVSGTRTLLLVNFRPEYDALWMERSYYQQMPLLPLTPQGTEELLADLLGRDLSLGGLVNRIGERTGGNPFFIEEVVQSLVESGSLTGSRGAYRLTQAVDALEIPPTVQVVLAARIDRLPEREKEVLQSAAVIGKHFSASILNRVVELSDVDLSAALSALQATEFIVEEALYPETEYEFKHPLTQEVACHSQLDERRREVHARVARAIAALNADKLDERAAQLAHHWGEANDRLEAARWHRRAADWAGMSNLKEALYHWRRVRALLEPLADSPETLRLGVRARIRLLQLSWRLGSPEEEPATLLAEGRRLAGRSGDLHRLAILVDAYGAARGLAGELDDWLKYAREATGLADETGDADLRSRLRHGLAISHLEAGHLREGLTFVEQGLELARGDSGAGQLGMSPYALLLFDRGWALAQMGDPIAAARELDRAAELAREQGAVEVLGWVHAVRGLLAEVTGDARTALRHTRQSVEIAERSGGLFTYITAYHMLGVVQLLSREWTEAGRALEQALAMARERRIALVREGFMLAYLAEAHLGSGDTVQARATAEEAIDVAHRRGTKSYEGRAHLAMARVLLRTEGATASTDIQVTLRQAQRLVEETGGKSQEPFIHEELAELARLTGDDATRQRELREAHRLFTEMGAAGHAERLAGELEV